MNILLLQAMNTWTPPPPPPPEPWSVLNYIELWVGIFLGIWLLSILVRPKNAMKHWHHHFADVQLSSKGVYQNIIAEMKKRQLPNVSFFYNKFFEAGIFSTRREFLIIEFKTFSLDVCCAQFGTGYYISWWLGIEEPGLISKIPVINTLVGKNPKYQSYYQIDTATMFQSAAHDAIMTVIDEIVKEKGMRQLSEFERQPMPGNK